MYDRDVDIPRLLSFYDEDDQLPDPVLAQARSAQTDKPVGPRISIQFRPCGVR
jgi:hypothetical protein